MLNLLCAFCICTVFCRYSTALCLGVGLKSLAVACMLMVYIFFFLHHNFASPWADISAYGHNNDQRKKNFFLSLCGQMQFLCFYLETKKLYTVLYTFLGRPSVLEPVFVFLSCSENGNLFIAVSLKGWFIYQVCYLWHLSQHCVGFVVSCKVRDVCHQKCLISEPKPLSSRSSICVSFWHSFVADCFTAFIL